MNKQNTPAMQGMQDLRSKEDAGRADATIGQQPGKLSQESDHFSKRSCNDSDCDAKKGTGFCFKCIGWL